MTQDIELPSTPEEWIDLFNRTSELIGYPDARDDFHRRNDLQYCLTACGALLETYDLVRWRRPSRPPFSVEGPPGFVFHVKYQQEPLGDEQVDWYLSLVRTEMESMDILPTAKVFGHRGYLKMALTKMANSSTVTGRLHLVSLEETIEKHGQLSEDT